QIKKETETLQNLQNELSQKLYSQAGAGAGQKAGPDGQQAGPGGPGAGAAGGKQAENNEEDVIDAEFEAKDE
ncbi:unnamed protein product, partial [marine sediment metagenome]